MRRFFFILVLFLIASLTVPMATQAARYAQCDACGLCKDTSKSTTNESYYIRPGIWQKCFECMYPTPAAAASGVDCEEDELLQTPALYDIQGTPAPTQRCDTILMADYDPAQTNSVVNAPESGRMFSDLGCISVDTTTGSFSDPNASVNVVQILLNFIISITGGVGTILVMATAVRLILSKGNPEKIREGKRALTNVVLGLLLTIFALFIFRFFASQVLRIPGFS
ncbi:hypothetical protein KBB12_01275 [Candidatus Woesebacteria bacterium]|nr:hypothetical protein [Candidatus Woesebacteria bacterium]